MAVCYTALGSFKGEKMMRKTEHSILMNTQMVQATLDDLKSQTRRVIREAPEGATELRLHNGFLETWVGDLLNSDDRDDDENWMAVIQGFESGVRCPYGQPGDTLWVKTPHYLFGQWAKDGTTKTGRTKWQFSYVPGEGVMFPDDPPEIICTSKADVGWFLRSPLFMPRWAAWLILDVTGVRVARVQDIDNNSALAEGTPDIRTMENNFEMRDCFRVLWDSINAKRGFGWDVNPWVWVVSFKRQKVQE